MSSGKNGVYYLTVSPSPHPLIEKPKDSAYEIEVQGRNFYFHVLKQQENPDYFPECPLGSTFYHSIVQAPFDSSLFTRLVLRIKQYCNILGLIILIIILIFITLIRKQS